MSSKRVTKSLINDSLCLNAIPADGANSTGGVVSTVLPGAAVGDRVLFVIGQVKIGTAANSFLTPVPGTHFERRISVAGHIQQLVAAGDLSASTYTFFIQPARTTIYVP
jgi:hypothetical protein